MLNKRSADIGGTSLVVTSIWVIFAVPVRTSLPIAVVLSISWTKMISQVKCLEDQLAFSANSSHCRSLRVCECYIRTLFTCVYIGRFQYVLVITCILVFLVTSQDPLLTLEQTMGYCLVLVILPHPLNFYKLSYEQ